MKEKEMKHWLRSLTALASILVLASVFVGQLARDASAEANQEKNQISEEIGQAEVWQGAGELNYWLESDASIEPDFGGVWIADNGRIQVGLIETRDSSARSREVILNIAADMRISEGVDVVPVQFSWTTLNQTRDAIRELQHKYIDYGNGVWPIQMGIKTDLNKVQVDIPADESKFTDGHHAVLSEIEKHYKNQVFFETYSAPAVYQSECNPWYCDSPIRGGVGLKKTSSGSGDIDCTAGFIVKGVASEKRFILTAGHCDFTSSKTWKTHTLNYSEKYIGGVIYSGHNLMNFDPSDRVDAMLIYIDQVSPPPPPNGNGWQTWPGIFKRSGTLWLDPFTPPPSQEERYSITGSAPVIAPTVYNSIVGEKVCTSGARTGGWPWPNDPHGGSCGKVKEVGKWLPVEYKPDLSTTYVYETLVHRAALCTRRGDSGGPVYDDNNKAKGIISSSGAPNGATVFDDYNPTHVCNDLKYFTPMNVIMNKYSTQSSGLTFVLW